MSDNSKIILDLDVLSSNKNSQVEIHLGGIITVTGFQVSDFRFGGGNQYNTSMDNSDIVNRLSDMAAKANQSANNLGLTSNAQFIIKTQVQTVLQWTGSDRFAFSIELLFLSWKRNDKKVLTPIKQLLAAVNPASTGQGGLSAGGLSFDIQTIAPLGYTTTNPNGIPLALGTSACRIGQWFAADQLVIKNVDFSVSKETFDDGKPLYAVATVQMETFKMLSALEVINFIKGD